MKVRDVMTENPITISVEGSVRDAARLLRQHRISGLPVVEGERVVGVVTERDILSLLKVEDVSGDLWLPSPLEVIEIPIREYFNWERTKKALASIGEMPVREVMSMPAIVIDEDAEIEEAAAIMVREDIARLPVVRGTKLVGIVTRADIVRGMSRIHLEGGREVD